MEKAVDSYIGSGIKTLVIMPCDVRTWTHGA